ncbi:uncharacterized protein [Nicotiana tomentosiformis]|uniref:uncharacterized protein n=1 Tax=Nicotiana tomentosiformis TaxID=4098 RepID=UPI00388C99ED
MPFPEEWNMKRKGVGKDAVLRPSSVEEEASASNPKPVKDSKRKRASAFEDPKPKTRKARKPRKNTIPLTMEPVLRLRDEDEEEEENDGSVLVARMKKTINAPKAAASMVIYKAPPRTEEMSGEGSGRVPKSLEIEDASHLRQQTVGISEGAGPEALRTEENAPSEPLGAIVVAVHREAFSRSRAELYRFEADLRRATEERNALRLLSGQREEEIKGLRAELAKAHQDQTDLAEQVMIILRTHGLDSGSEANISISQLQQKLEMIGQLREEVDIIRAKTMGWKDGMDRLAAEKETVRAQLSSTVSQLQGMKEKSSVQARRIEELEARLASELAKAKSDAEKAKSYADALVAVYRGDAEAAQCPVRTL